MRTRESRSDEGRFGASARRVGILAVVALCCLLCACNTALYTGLDEYEANEMVMVLNNNGIKAAKTAGTKGTWDVQVAADLVPRSVEVLTASGLPRQRYLNMGDIFKKDGMVSTPTEEQARLVFAISQELAGTIAQIDGVLSARVHLVLPEMDSFGKKISPSTASVFIKHRADVDLGSQTGFIKRLVENSVRDLKLESVSLFLFPSALQAPPRLPPRYAVLGVEVPPAYVTPVWAGLIALLGLALAGVGLAVWRRKKS